MSVDAVEAPGARTADPEVEQAACNLCGEELAERVYAACPDRRHWLPGVFDVVQCVRCGLVRTMPRPTRGAIGRYYPESYAPFLAEGGRRSRIYAALRTLARAPYTLRYGSLDPWPPSDPDANRLLDIGSGSGLFLEEMTSVGWNPWGIEPSERMARATIERMGLEPERIFVGTAEEATYDAESFDLVAMAHVLEHLHDPKGTLLDVARWLRPGGTLKIWVPNFASLESRVFGRLWFGLDVPRHLFHFTPSTLRRMLEACGFEVERVIPQYQVNTLSQSIPHVVDAVLRRRRDFRESMRLYYAFLPVAALLLAAGTGGTLDVTARKPARGGVRDT